MSKQRAWQSWFWFFLKRGFLIFLGVILLLTLLQRHLIYYPTRSGEASLRVQAEEIGLYPWRDRADAIIGWRTSPPDAASLPRNRMVVFHGNAGFALHRSYYVHGFHGTSAGRATWELLLFEYPGYGARPGTPGEERICDAARQALRELLQEDSRPIYLLGESLGSSFASRLAAENAQSVSGLILVTPLTCLADVAAMHYPFLPVRLMLREDHNVQDHLKSYPGPVAFLVAGRDEIMRNRLGELLYQRYSGRKKMWIQAEAQHNTLDFSLGSPWWKEVEDFLQQSNNAFTGAEDYGI
jgi:pimeloyl-ACP methyl ester carboxylesterase